MDNINVEVKLQKQIGDVKIVMLKGDDGASIASIDKTSTEGLVDTYTITLTDGRHTTFQVTNGSSIATIEKTASIGHTDIYTITLTDGSTSTFEVTNGDNWIDNDEKTATDFFETINGGLLSSLKVSLTPNQDLHGYDNPWVGGAGKNKINCDAPTVTINGVTVTNNGDGTFTATGTITAQTDFFLTNGGSSDLIPLGDITDGYLVNGCPNGGGTSSYQLILGSLNSRYATDSGNGDTLRNVLQVGIRVILRVFSNYSFPTGGLTFKPMIRASGESADFASYSNICPISGHTQVKVQNHQKNLFNPSNVIIGYIGQSGGAYKIIAYADARTIYARCEPNTTYTISKTAGKRFSVGWSDTLPDIGVIVNDSVYDATASVVTFTTGATAKYIVAFVWLGTQDTITADEMLASCQIELGSTATPYVPYNGYQVTVNLGGTYYSGTLDVVSGKLTVDKAFVKGNGLTWLKHNTSANNVYYSGELQSIIKRPSDNYTIGDIVCSDYVAKAWENVFDANQVGVVISTSGLLGVANPNITTLEDFQTAIADTDICYGLSTPTPIQLSPTMVKALVGENHLSAPLDGQEIVESKYRYVFTWDDVNGITDGLKDRIDDIEDVLAETSYTSAVSCLVDDTTCTITDSKIKTTSLIEVFSSNSSGDTTVVTNIAVTNGQAVLTFDALVEATSFKLRITNL